MEEEKEILFSKSCHFSDPLSPAGSCEMHVLRGPLEEEGAPLLPASPETVLKMQALWGLAKTESRPRK